MNKKVRMTVAIPAEHGSKVYRSALRRIQKMSFTCLDKKKVVGNLKKFIKKCKKEVSNDTYLDHLN